MRLKKNDTVKIIAGKDKGKIGKIVQVNPETEKVIVQGLNMVSKTFRGNLRQSRIASGSHIGCTNQQSINSIFI